MEDDCPSYEKIEEIAQFLLTRTKQRPKIAIICGSGLGGLADLLEDQDAFLYSEIPGFPVSTVEGHKGRLVFGKLKGVNIVCMQGRFHGYEGYSLMKCCIPVRVLKHIGVDTMIVTNAAGGLNEGFSVGDVMLIKDHINMPGFTGNNPLRGRNEERWGTRFPAVSNAYDRHLRNLAKTVAKQTGLEKYLREGVYVMVGGPSFETVSESRALKLMGADAVGMSTVHEVITSRHCGMRVLGISLITNKAVLEYDQDHFANHAEVLETANNRKPDLERFVTLLVQDISSDIKNRTQ